MAVHLAIASDLFDGVLFCAVLCSHEVSWMRSETELSLFLRIFLPTFRCGYGYLLFFFLLDIKFENR